VNESKFRERRSAFREEDESAGPTPEPEALPPETVASAPGPPARVVPSPPESAPVPSADEEMDAAGLAGAYLDQLAGMEPPPPSFLEELVEPHIERALGFLGQLPLTPEGDRRVLPQWAKHEIDLLGILEERTRGNLSPDERRALDQTLVQLRTLYLKVVQ
jgi:hypothetical protein